MGSGGDKKVHLKFGLHMPHFHFHHHCHGDRGVHIPKGCVAITVGQGEEQSRFVIPVMYVNHPLFMRLLKDAEEEYGFNQDGPINIPCHVEEFCRVRDMIDMETTTFKPHPPPHHHHYRFLCFTESSTWCSIISAALFPCKVEDAYCSLFILTK